MTTTLAPPRTARDPGPCAHCGKVALYFGRRLCHRCFMDRAVRVQYPFAPGAGRTPRAKEPTDEELDALIEAGRFDMPREPLPEGRKPPAKKFTSRAVNPTGGRGVPFDPAGGRVKSVKWVWKDHRRYVKVEVPAQDPAWAAVYDRLTDLWVWGGWSFERVRRADRAAREGAARGESAADPDAFLGGY